MILSEKALRQKIQKADLEEKSLTFSFFYKCKIHQDQDQIQDQTLKLYQQIGK